MGLDMYLYKKSYIMNGDWLKEEYRESVTVTKGGNPHDVIKDNRIKYVVEEVGYWRKVNQIHKWFVDNVQNGVDDCGIYPVSRHQLEDLLNLCEQTLEKDKQAEELLPTQAGFFFGSTDYDEWYFKDIEQTVSILKECLNDEDAEEFEYTSSW